MNHFITLCGVFFFLFNTLTGVAQWQRLSFPNQQDLIGVAFSYTDTVTGVVISETDVYKTTNSGSSWARQVISNNSADSLIFEKVILQDVEFIFGGFVVIGIDTSNNNGYIFQNKSGSTWKLVKTEPGKGFKDLTLRSSSLITVGDSGLMYRSSDTGSTWISIATGTTKDLYKIGSDGGNIYAYGDDILISNNSLVGNWSRTNTIHSYRDITTINRNRWMAVDSRKFDGNYANTSQTRFTGSLDARCIENVFGSPVLVGTDNGILVSPRYRNYWERLPSTSGMGVSHINMLLNTRIAFAVGDSGLVIKTSDINKKGIPFTRFSTTGSCKDSVNFFVNDGYSNMQGYTYSWKINGTPVSSSLQFDSAFSVVGTYSATLVVNNGTHVDSMQQNFDIVFLPDTSLSISPYDTMLCKIGEVLFSIDSSEINTRYSLIRLPDMVVVSDTIGNGSVVSLSTGVISDSTYYLVKAQHIYASCDAEFGDTLFVGVEKTKSKPNPAFINADLNEVIPFYNHSQQASTYQWSFGTGASVSSSTQFEPRVSYSQLGRDTITLIATSALGCKDTAVEVSTHIYDSKKVDADCWAKNIDGAWAQNNGREHNSGMLTLVAKNQDILIIGEYGENTFNGTAGITNDTLPGAGFYLARYTNSGVLKWFVRGIDTIPSMSLLYDYHEGLPLGLEEDEDGNILVTGYKDKDYLLQRNYDDSLPFHRYDKGFVLKVDSNGLFQWYTGNEGDAVGFDVACDNKNNIYVSGFCKKNDRLFSVSGSSISLTTSTAYRTFVLKYSPAGEILWHVNFVNGGHDIKYGRYGAMDCDPQGNVYIGGGMGNTLIIEPAIGSNLVYNGSGRRYSNYFVKLNSNGGIVWNQEISSVSSSKNHPDYFDDIHVTNTGDVAFAIALNNLASPQAYVDLPSINKVFSRFNYGNYLLASYTPGGDLNWAVGTKYSAVSQEFRISSDPVGNIYCSGLINAAVSTEFISTDGPSHFLSYNGSYFFLVKYDSLGAIQWLTRENGKAGNLPNTYTKLWPHGMSVDKNQNVFVTGEIRLTNSKPWSIIASDTLFSDGNDAFIAKFNTKACLDYSKISSSMPQTIFCEGSQLTMQLRAINATNIQAGNQYIVELSSISGDYSSASVVGQKTSSNLHDSVLITIPTVATSGVYYLRVRSTLPQWQGNEIQIQIHKTPTAINQQISVCRGQNAQFKANFGSKYVWTPSLSPGDSIMQQHTIAPNSSITYYVNVDNACQRVTDTFALVVNDTFYTTLPDTILCAGSTLQFHSQLINQAGTYNELLSSAHGCDSTIELKVTYSALPTVTLNAFPSDTICIFSGLQTLPNGSPAGGIYSGSGVTGASFDPQQARAGQHVVIYEVTDTNGCSGMDSAFIVVDLCLGTGFELNNAPFKAYPNPIHDHLYIELDREYSEIEIQFFDIQGKLILEISEQHKMTLSLPVDIPAGEYFVKCRLDHDRQYSFKVVKAE